MEATLRKNDIDPFPDSKSFEIEITNNYLNYHLIN